MQTTDDAIGAATGRIPSGCSILTVAHGDQRTGVLVSWVQQASFEPLQLTVCVKRGRPAADLIDGAGRFVLNVIGDDPSVMFKHFGKGFSLEEDAFAGIDHGESDFGPVLPGCIARIGCEVKDRMAGGDHDVYLVDVKAGDGDAAESPYVHIRKSGKTY